MLCNNSSHNSTVVEALRGNALAGASKIQSELSCYQGLTLCAQKTIECEKCMQQALDDLMNYVCRTHRTA